MRRPNQKLKNIGSITQACTGKCQPILKHMLHGMALDENLLICNYGEGKSVEIIHQDDDILIVNKPTEIFIGTRKTSIRFCIPANKTANTLKRTGPLIVHRLDMATSGLMVIALNPQANKYLQKTIYSSRSSQTICGFNRRVAVSG